MGKKSWESFKVGDKLTTNSITVTETHIVGFAGLTGDYYPLHVNEEYAKKTQFGGRIAHGPLTFCLAVGLVGQSELFGGAIMAFLGCDALRLLAPVKIGDTIKVITEVVDNRPTSKNDRGITVINYTVVNQEDEPILTSKMNFMMRRKRHETLSEVK